ncbi:MAG: AAA family ATPase [Thermoplasmatota archaeon]
MRILRLRLHNFRRHRDTEVEFPDGVLAIVGPNGAGKSTLLEAVAFALYGPKAAGTGKDLIRSEDAPPGDHVRVELDLEVAGQALRLVRELRGKLQNPVASLEVDGHLQVQPIAGSSDQVTQQVERILGLDRDGFFHTVVARQRDLDRLGRLKPAERREFILCLFGIGAVDGAIAAARAKRNEVRTQTEEAARHVGDEAAIAQQVAAAQVSEADARRKADEAVVALAQGEQALTAVEARLEAARVAHAERLALDHQVTALAGAAEQSRRATERARVELVAAEQAAARAEPLRAEAEALESIGAQLANAQGLVLVQSRRSVQQARITQEEATAQRLLLEAEAIQVPPRPDLATLALAVEAAAASVGRAERAQAVAVDRLAQGRREAAAFEGLQGSAACPSCRQLVTAEHLEQERSAVRAKLAALEGVVARGTEAMRVATAQANQARVDLAASQVEVQRIDALLRQKEQISQRATGLQATIAALREALPPDPGPLADLAELKRKADASRAARTELAKAEAAASRLTGLRQQLSEAEQAWQAASAHLADLRLRLATQADTASALASAGAAVTQAQSALVRLRSAHTAALLAAQAAGQTLAVAVAEQERNRLARGRLDDLHKEMARWTAIVGASGGGLLERFREHLVSRTAPAINQEASQLLALFTQGRYTELILDDSYEVHMGDGGRLLPLERFSGGEQDLAHLARRLGISRLLATRSGAPEIRFLALDEVFSSLDSERCDALLGALRGLTGLYSQVFAITHLERLQESFDSVVQVKLSDGASLVSVHSG